jgi:UDPglucose 6-dehydrogenase
MIIGFIGMSHLGLVSTIGAASKGFSVIGFDEDKDLISNLVNSKIPIEEPNLFYNYESNKSNIKFTSNYKKISECDLIYIAKDVKLNREGFSDLSEIEKLIADTKKFVRNDSCLVILSQVSPGFTRNMRKKFNVNIIYQVETLVFGNALERYLNPERFILGLDDPSQTIHSSLKFYLSSFNCKILTMSFESAELAKISINVFLAASITATNSMCALAEKIGANWQDIKKSLILDRRIGTHSYVQPGLGISGGNIERDIITSLMLSNELGTDSSLFEAIQFNSDSRKLWPSKIIEKKFDLNKVQLSVAVWGLAYKKDTHSIKNSPAIENIRKLSNNCTFKAFDPIVKLPKLNEVRIQEFTEILDSLNGVDVLIIFNDSNAFREISVSQIEQRMKGNLVIDPFGVVDISSRNGLELIGLGMPELGKSN